MQVLITDVWADHNAIDRANLDVLVGGLRERWPGCRITVVAARREAEGPAPAFDVVADLMAVDEAGLARQMAGGDEPTVGRLSLVFEDADVVISAGGLFRSVPQASRRDIPLLSRLLHLNWALDRKVPVALPGQVVTELAGGAVCLALRATLSRVGFISSCDTRSLELLRSTGTAARAQMGAPLSAGVVPAATDDVVRAMKEARLPEQALIVAMGETSRRLGDDLFATAEVIDHAMAEHGLPVILVGTNMPPDRDPQAQSRERAVINDDLLALRALEGLVRRRDALFLCPGSMTPGILAGLMQRSRAILGVGTWLVVPALGVGKPCGCLASPAGLESLFGDLGLEDLTVPACEKEAASRRHLLDRLLNADSVLERRLARGRETLKARAAKDWNRLERLVETAGLPPASQSIARQPVASRAAAVGSGRQPAVSVIIPAYNRLDLLEPVLEGFVRETTRNDCEVIVVDDGSDPPVRRLFEGVAPVPGLRLVERPVNGGRGAALNTGVEQARGRIVIFCDSDIAPEEGFVAEHLAFHEAHPSMLASHLGALEWGVEPGFLGWHLGARGNPAMRRLTGEVPWQTWYTDNWSFKRELFIGNGVTLDETFKVWGWEELDLALRLRDLGATSVVTGTGCGRHLRSIEPESFCHNFRRGVPNLVYLASLVSEDEDVRSWLSNRFNSPRVLEACENLVHSLWMRCLELDSKDRVLLRSLEDPLVGRLGDALMTSFFRISVARGFMDLTTPALAALPEVNDVETTQLLAYLTTLVYLIGLRVDSRPRCEEILLGQIERLLHEGRFASDMEDRFVGSMQYWTGEFARLAKDRGAPLVS